MRRVLVAAALWLVIADAHAHPAAAQAKLDVRLKRRTP
jgi:hypothetical protein